MKTTTSELKAKLADQLFRLEKAKSTGFMVNQETDRMRNILMNNAKEIVEALEIAEDAEERIMILEAEIEDADEELSKLDDEIKQLKLAADETNGE